MDIDDGRIACGKSPLGTARTKDTVNQALRRAAVARAKAVQRSFDVLGRAVLEERERAWR